MNLTEENFKYHAFRVYENPNCVGMKEFNEDINRFRYIVKLFTRYKKKKVLKERLILNHIIVLYNVFGINATKFLFFKVPEKHWPLLKTFLTFLNHMPEEVHGVKSEIIFNSDIPLVTDVCLALRKV